MRKIPESKIYFKNKLTNRRSVKEIIEKRYSLLIIFIILIIGIIGLNLLFIQIVKQEHYINQIKLLNKNIIYGPSVPRGRIYDRHHRLIVDNKPVKVIYYKKESGVTTSKEIEMAYEVANIIDLNYKISSLKLKEFWLINNSDLGNEKITAEEWRLLEERKLTFDEIKELKLDRITKEELSYYNETDKLAAHIFHLMNDGYYFAEKVIKK